jgi:hypothetical protein
MTVVFMAGAWMFIQVVDAMAGLTCHYRQHVLLVTAATMFVCSSYHIQSSSCQN